MGYLSYIPCGVPPHRLPPNRQDTDSESVEQVGERGPSEQEGQLTDTEQDGQLTARARSDGVERHIEHQRHSAVGQHTHTPPPQTHQHFETAEGSAQSARIRNRKNGTKSAKCKGITLARWTTTGEMQQSQPNLCDRPNGAAQKQRQQANHARHGRSNWKASATPNSDGQSSLTTHKPSRLRGSEGIKHRQHPAQDHTRTRHDKHSRCTCGSESKERREIGESARVLPWADGRKRVRRNGRNPTYATGPATSASESHPQRHDMSSPIGGLARLQTPMGYPYTPLCPSAPQIRSFRCD